MSKMGKKFGFKILAGLILLLLVLDAMLAPMLSYMLLQYPDLFAIITPEMMFGYVVVIEVVLNGLVMFLVYLVNNRGKR
jgi:hypothetical protein